ncbi:MAG: hypothetical protein M3N28_04720 [Actinomycetota bacterium]|nr:hypothetical protein [Actinomycetota bacterium]
MISPSDIGWDSVVVAGARVTSGWAGAEQFHYYSELAEAVNAEVPDADLEAFGHPMNRILYDIVMTGRSFDPRLPDAVGGRRVEGSE